MTLKKRRWQNYYALMAIIGWIGATLTAATAGWVAGHLRVAWQYYNQEQNFTFNRFLINALLYAYSNFRGAFSGLFSPPSWNISDPPPNNGATDGMEDRQNIMTGAEPQGPAPLAQLIDD